MLAVKKTVDGVWLYFAHNTDTFVCHSTKALFSKSADLTYTRQSHQWGPKMKSLSRSCPVTKATAKLLRAADPSNTGQNLPGSAPAQLLGSPIPTMILIHQLHRNQRAPNRRGRDTSIATVPKPYKFPNPESHCLSLSLVHLIQVYTTLDSLCDYHPSSSAGKWVLTRGLRWVLKRGLRPVSGLLFGIRHEDALAYKLLFPGLGEHGGVDGRVGRWWWLKSVRMMRMTDDPPPFSGKHVTWMQIPR